MSSPPRSPQALQPLYAYLIPLLAAVFLLALILKEIPLRTRAQRDAAQAAPAQPGARPQDAAATSPSTSQPPAAPPQVAATPTTLRRRRLPHR
jgi:hypothetical protein